MRVPEWLSKLDNTVIGFVREYSIPILRIALGVVFVWFGVLKVVGVSPVADLVAKTLYFLPPRVAVVGMGAVELIIGVGLVTGIAVRLVLLLFIVQMVGTFLALIIRPDMAFQGGNPLILSVHGEFIIKNLVLISAGLVILGTVRAARPAEPIPEMLGEKAHSASDR